MIIDASWPEAYNIVIIDKATGKKAPAAVLIDTDRRIVRMLRAKPNNKGVWTCECDSQGNTIVDELSLDNFRIEHIDRPGIEWVFE